MRSKIFLLALVLILGMFAANASAEANAVPAIDRAIEAEAPAEELFTPNCDAEAASDTNTLPDLFAAPIHQMAWPTTCGSCSEYKCRGRVEGSWCGFNVWCIAATGNFCSGTQEWNCRCTGEYF